MTKAHTYSEEVADMDIHSVLATLPGSIKAYVVANPDMSFTIVLNDALSFEQNRKSYLHEYAHIVNGDYDKKFSADMIELNAHLLIAYAKDGAFFS